MTIVNKSRFDFSVSESSANWPTYIYRYIVYIYKADKFTVPNKMAAVDLKVNYLSVSTQFGCNFPPITLETCKNSLPSS